MLKVKTFFQVLLDSLLPHQPYYHTILRKPFAASVRYFLFLMFFVYGACTILYFVRFETLRELPEITKQFSTSLKSFPDNLVITLHNGRLSTNYGRPYLMWMDYQDKKVLLFAVDQNASPAAMEMYHPISLITAKEVVTRSLDNSTPYTVTPFDGMSTTVRKAQILQFNELFEKIVSVAMVLGPVLLLTVFPLLMFLVNLLYVLFISLAVYLFAKHRYNKLTFAKTLQLSLHASTLPLLVNYGMGLVSVNVSYFPFAFLILLLLFTSIAVYEAHYQPSRS